VNLQIRMTPPLGPASPDANTCNTDIYRSYIEIIGRRGAASQRAPDAWAKGSDVARPALSASRTTAVLDLLTAYPDRAFKMSEVVQATRINVASCHAVLNALCKAGYLTRTPRRTYVLGPALIAVGQAASRAHPLIDRAQRAAEELFEEVRVPVFLTTIVGEEILILSAVADRSAHPLAVRAGQRQPAVAPLGAHLVAWSPPPVIEDWIAKAGVADAAAAEEWRRSLALIRQRGFQVTLHESDDQAFAELIAQMAEGARALDYRDQTLSFLNSHRLRFAQPPEINAEALYDVSAIAAPIFGQGTEPHLSLSFGAFRDRLTGDQVKTYADRLLRACLRVMRPQRTL
jgi:DNA-binding IclR family transcriptional regulator